MAAVCAADGSAMARLGGACIGGGAMAAAGAGGGAAGGAVGGAGGAATAAGWGGGAAGAAGAAGIAALTAVWQAGDSLARLRLRHSKASRPPGWTPEQFAMKSERHEARIALACADVGCCARAGPDASATKTAASAVKPCILFALGDIPIIPLQVDPTIAQKGQDCGFK